MLGKTGLHAPNSSPPLFAIAPLSACSCRHFGTSPASCILRALAGPSGLAMPTREGKNLAFAEWTVYFHGEFTQKEGLRLLKAAFQGETLRGSRQGWIRLKRAFPTCVMLAWQNPAKFDAAAKFVAQTTGLSRTDFKLAPETASAPPDSREAAASAAAGSGRRLVQLPQARERKLFQRPQVQTQLSQRPQPTQTRGPLQLSRRVHPTPRQRPRGRSVH